MRYARAIASDLVRAAAVLALVFLSFSHAPVAAAGHGPNAFGAPADASFCGDAPDQRADDHAPCHACRVGGAILPPAEGGLIGSCAIWVAAELLPRPGFWRTDVQPGLPAARGPPHLA